VLKFWSCQPFYGASPVSHESVGAKPLASAGRL